MALTQNQDIPLKPRVEEPWTMRKLISLKSAATEIAKVFSALEIVLLFMVLISGAGELFGRKLSFGWYFLLVLVLVANIYLRHLPQDKDMKPKSEKE